MIVSSGGVHEPYKTLGLVVGFASKQEGCSGKVPIEMVYKLALSRLMESATAKGANGVLFVSFQNRVAAGAGCANGVQAFEVCAWGTAVKIEL